ncbi:hypothetical protein K1T71_014372 [Dendrolimus kikuchii]|uniref:Uncharacterized protein n=1 Tax=Dendrolimus kikuchii TaxID=765133 RepID=A0ACC1CDZ4_9NEOP|nr:hypothetical protein K1T71_014372 [Dendrolimus kikuchii]
MNATCCRAICGRIEAHISSLPPPFRLHRPMLARAASMEARTPARAPAFCVSWCATTPTPEFMNAITGKLECGQPSLLCKQSMFARWQYLVKRLPHLPEETHEETTIAEAPSYSENMLYNEAKQLCPVYQTAKERLLEAFEKGKLGRWIKKPLEQDQFVCELTDPDPKLLFT